MPKPGRGAVRALLAVLFASLSAPAAGQLTVTEAWVRGTVPGQSVTGAYMTLRATRPVTIVAVASPVAKTVELHEMSLQGGVMRMRHLAQLPLAAGASVELKPGGYHVMMTDVTRPLREGEKVPITLTLRDDNGKESTLTVNAAVRPMMETGHGAAHR